jgi:hypothetical protein
MTYAADGEQSHHGAVVWQAVEGASAHHGHAMQQRGEIRVPSGVVVCKDLNPTNFWCLNLWQNPWFGHQVYGAGRCGLP